MDADDFGKKDLENGNESPKKPIFMKDWKNSQPNEQGRWLHLDARMNRNVWY